MSPSSVRRTGTLPIGLIARASIARLSSILAHVNASKRQVKTRKDHLHLVHVASLDIAKERQHCPCFHKAVEISQSLISYPLRSRAHWNEKFSAIEDQLTRPARQWGK